MLDHELFDYKTNNLHESVFFQIIFAVQLKTMFSFVVFVALINVVAKAQWPSYGACPTMQTVQDFKLDAFMGVWYEQARFFDILEMGTSCVTFEFEKNGNNSVSVNCSYYSQILRKNLGYVSKLGKIRKVFRKLTNTYILRTGHHSMFGLSRYEGDDTVAEFGVMFPFLEQFEENLFILDTDYTNFALLWACNDLYLVKTEYAWVLTRNRFPGEEYILKLKDNLVNHEIDINKLSRTDQVRCFKK